MSDSDLRITLINLQTFISTNVTATGARADRGNNPRMGIQSLANWMDKNGYPMDSWDYYDMDMLLPSDEKLEEYFRRVRPNVIGLSAIVSSCYKQVRRVSAIARRICPDAWIVMGGHLAAAANVILHKTDVDICVVGDGEYAWIDLLNYFQRASRQWIWEDLKAIKGLCYLDEAGKLNFNGFAQAIPASEMVQPNYDLLIKGLQDQPELVENFFSIDHWVYEHDERVQKHWSRRGAYMVSAKGCVARCTFCQRSTKGYRRLMPQTIEEHVVMLKERFGVGIVYFFDENFGSDRHQARAIADVMAKHDMLWATGSMRVTTFNREDLEYFMARGCLGGGYGLESGSEIMLEALEKRITVKDILTTIQNSAEVGWIFTQTNLLVGNPGETEQTAQETGRLMGQIAHLMGVPLYVSNGGPSYVIPMPGTPLYEYAQKQGVIPTDLDGEEAYLLYLAEVPNSYKYLYTNVAGAPRAEVAFWDILARMEASRTYRELTKKHPRPETHTSRILIAEWRRKEKLGLTRNSFMARFSVFEFVLWNPVIDALPRWFIYPIVKWSNYLINEVLKGYWAKVTGRQHIRGFPGAKGPPRLVLDTSVSARERGLRHMLKTADEEVLSPEEESLRLLVRQQ